MQQPSFDFELPIQHKGFTINTVVKAICQEPNQAQPFWPVLLYPKNDTEQDPARDSAQELLFFYWKKCEDISQFPVYLDQLVHESKHHQPHTEWNACFEKIYTKTISLMKLTLEIIDLLKHNQDQEKIVYLNNLFKGYNKITSDNQQEIYTVFSSNPDLQNFQTFLESSFLVSYNHLILQTAKHPNESLNEFQNRLNTIFSGPFQALTYQ